MSENRGRFIWYELLSHDPDTAIAFYRDLVGWGHMPWPGEMKYDLFTVNDVPQAGTLQLPAEARQNGAPSHWLGYVWVDDLEAALARGLELGASKMAQMQFDVGEMAVLQDPQGAFLALFKPKEEPAPECDAENGHVAWHELATSDYEAAWEFYAAMFGWEIDTDMDMGEHGTYRIFARNGKRIGGMFNRPPEMPVSSWLYYVRVPSCHSAAGRIAELGGSLVNGPMQVPGGDTVLQAIDPTGAMFALHAKTSTTDAGR